MVSDHAVHVAPPHTPAPAGYEGEEHRHQGRACAHRPPGLGGNRACQVPRPQALRTPGPSGPPWGSPAEPERAGRGWGRTS